VDFHYLLENPQDYQEQGIVDHFHCVQILDCLQEILTDFVQDLSGVGVHAQDLEVEVDLLHLVAAEVGQSLLQGVNQDPQPEVDQAHKEVDQDHQEVDQDHQPEVDQDQLEVG
jgi:hypothetical protein